MKSAIFSLLFVVAEWSVKIADRKSRILKLRDDDTLSRKARRENEPCLFLTCNNRHRLVLQTPIIKTEAIASRCKNHLSVILNEVKDLELVEKTRFFAPLRMTGSRGLGFCNSF